MKKTLITLSIFSVFALGVTESNAQVLNPSSGSVTIGSVKYYGAVAGGDGARAWATNSTALGSEAHVETGVEGGIALGQDTYASRRGGEVTDKYFIEPTDLNSVAWKSCEGCGALSIGSDKPGWVYKTRQITGVAAGSELTDAANVAQLYNLRDYSDSELKAAKESFNNQFTVMGERVGVLETSMEALKDGFTIRPKNGYQEIRVRQGDVTMGGNRIQDVGDAVAATDAVNKRQLDSTARSLHKKINDVDKDMKAGVAMALAVASLPQAYVPGKSMLAMSAGTYQGQSGFALGLSHATENRAWIVKGSATVDTRGNFGGSLGAGYQF